MSRCDWFAVDSVNDSVRFGVFCASVVSVIEHKMLFVLIAISFACFVYWKIVKPHDYWKERGVKQGFQAFLLGDFWGTTIRKHSFADLVSYMYNKFPNDRYSGGYQFLKPILLIRDPNLIRQLTVKDFDHFTDHSTLITDDSKPLWSRNLFQLTGQKWRDMRATLSPAFTSSKMRTMFVLMYECAGQLVDHFERNVPQDEAYVIEMKDTFTRITNDVIATCAFGVHCDSLEERDNTFYKMGRKITDFTSFTQNFKFVMLMISPRLCQWLGIHLFTEDLTNFFKTLVADTVKVREEKNVVRPDMIHLLMEARKDRHGQESTDITLDDMTAQALLFFFGGFDTVSTVMSFMGYEIAVNSEVQTRLAEEVDSVMEECKGTLNYDVLNKMTYLDMVISETLRKWPPGPGSDRVCVSPYTIQPEADGEVAVEMQKGDTFVIPTWALHHDPKYFDNPERFDPERFDERNKDKIKPYTYLPFGVGPRNCIASRFALMELKTMFVMLLSKFEFVVVERTSVPLRLSKAGLVMTAEGGFWVGLKRRK